MTAEINESAPSGLFNDEAQLSEVADLPIDWRRRYEDVLEGKVAAERQLVECYREMRERESELEAANRRIAHIPILEDEVRQVRSLNKWIYLP